MTGSDSQVLRIVFGISLANSPKTGSLARPSYKKKRGLLPALALAWKT
jgi:hypothetical protein